MTDSRSRALAKGRWRVAAEDFDRLPRASEEEEDMLDLAAGATRTSRLACQILLDASLDGLTVRMPPEHRDMQGR
jgi:ferredoxin-2, mitochondrial